MDILKHVKSLLFILAVTCCLVYSASAQTSGSDTTKRSHQTDTSNVLRNKLPGFFPQSKSGIAKKDASDFSMYCGPYKPDKSNQPLIIVDGKKMSYKKLQKINVNNIKTITILKDSASISKYGRKARNGVLIVTTNKNVTS
jgi:TonB-dependent SusC/RagA subfamily outer membrane receptor